MWLFQFFVVPSVWVVIIACVAGVGSPEPNFSTHPTPTQHRIFVIQCAGKHLNVGRLVVDLINISQQVPCFVFKILLFGSVWVNYFKKQPIYFRCIYLATIQLCFLKTNELKAKLLKKQLETLKLRFNYFFSKGHKLIKMVNYCSLHDSFH